MLLPICVAFYLPGIKTHWNELKTKWKCTGQLWKCHKKSKAIVNLVLWQLDKEQVNFGHVN